MPSLHPPRTPSAPPGVLRRLVLLWVVCLGLSSQSPAQTVKAFPSAEGFGQNSLGGRGGVVHQVTNLNDSGPGSLRAAVEASGARTVVFRVDGTIRLLSPLRVRQPHLTIAGQSAPGDGICLSGYGLQIEASHVTVRYLRIRPGDIANADVDGIHIVSGRDIIVDHCSVSWSVDETVSVTPDPDRVTVQWCLIAESLDESVHSSGGSHGKASLIRGRNGAAYSLHHNLFAHHTDRIPQVNGMDLASTDAQGVFLDFRNNVIYNWGDVLNGYEAAGADRDSDSVARYNFIANDYRIGPDTLPGFLPVPQFPGFALRYWIFEELCPFARAHFSGNALDGVVWSDPWNPVSVDDDVGPGYRQSSPFAITGGEVQTESIDLMRLKVLARAGASLRRDSADARIVQHVLNGTGSMIDSQDDVGGWPGLATATAPPDSDLDGIPDSVEVEWGLNPSLASDRNGDLDGNGYTNLEDYLNGLVDPPIVYRMTVTSEGQGTVSPRGVVEVNEFETQRFSATPALYWELGEVWLDGAPSSLTAVNDLGPILSDHQVHIRFTPQVTSPHATPLEWLAGYGLVSDLGDPNQNGLEIWQEYRLGLSPFSGRPLLEVLKLEGDSVQLRFIRPNPARAGMASQLRQSANLSGWIDSSGSTEDIEVVEDGAEQVTFRATVGSPPSPFFRMRYSFD